MFPEGGICRDAPGKDGSDTMGARPWEADGRGGTVLPVEDADVVRDLVANMLESGGSIVIVIERFLSGGYLAGKGILQNQETPRRRGRSNGYPRDGMKRGTGGVV